tara:strand:+ start:396 stop:812 length:417 start_codon:yes stop_codon:yes gene_type:complete
MNTLLLLIIFVPVIEIYLFIKIGSQIGAISTILLIFLTAFLGVYYAKFEGLQTLKSGFSQIVKNQTPIYEIISGATIAIAAVLLILPGFLTDLFGFTLIFPFTRKFLLSFLSSRYSKRQFKKNDFIEGEFEDKDEKNE